MATYKMITDKKGFFGNVQKQFSETLTRSKETLEPCRFGRLTILGRSCDQGTYLQGKTLHLDTVILSGVGTIRRECRALKDPDVASVAMQTQEFSRSLATQMRQGCSRG